MRFLVACLAAVPALVSAWQQPPIARSVKRDASSSSTFTFNEFEGPDLQEQIAFEGAGQLEYTTSEGQDWPNPYAVQRLGTTGPLLLQDYHMIENFAHFERERIPERTVHAKGAGAHGYFQVTTDFAKNYTMADVFQRVGEMTPITMRLSTVAGEHGSGDVVRDPRGFSVKIRTQTGILDWVFNNTPVFFIRDPLKFISFIHTQKRNPQTNLHDKDMFWDYLSSNPESLYQVLRLFSDLGTPAGFQYMNGWSGHAYRLVQPDDSWVYVKVSLYTDQGIRNHTNEEANYLMGVNPDYLTQSLYDAIESGDYPSWTVYFQVMTAAEAEAYQFNVLDLTQEWDPKDVPLHEVGKLVLTQNPENYFAEIEQIGFSPSNMVDGWQPSMDPVLQARLFAYPDAQRYRLGTNYQQIPVNCPINPVANFQRDGFMNIHGNQGNRPNYPSTIQPINFPTAPYTDNHTVWMGGALEYLSTIAPIDFLWPQYFWGNLSVTDQDHLVSNVVGHLGMVNSTLIRERQVAVFARANQTLGERIARGVNVTVNTSMAYLGDLI